MQKSWISFVWHKQLNEAEKWYRKAVSLDSNYADACAGLGMTLIHNLNREEAEEWLKKAIRLDPALIEAWHSMGILYDIKNEQTKSRDYFLHATQLDPYRAHSFESLGAMPIEINPDRERHFYRSIYLSIRKKDFHKIGTSFKIAVKADVPMLVHRMASLLSLKELDSYTSYNQIIQESNDKTRYFRALIEVWRNEARDLNNSLLAEAIIHYWMGDPVAAYTIFDKELDADNRTMNL